jgi:serine/threonine-protein kinase
MGLFENYKINKAVNRLLTAPTGTSPEAVQAAAVLQRCDTTTTILKLLEALGKAPPSRALLSVLETYAQNTTLTLLGEGLASTNTRVVAAVGDVLAQAQHYDPNHLFEYWKDPRIPKATLGKLITAHAKRLEVDKLLHCLETARPEERQPLFSVLVQVATAHSAPTLVKHLATKDDAFRLVLARLIARFDTEDVRQACLGLLRDPQAAIRQAALEGLKHPEFALDVAPICRLLQDADPTVRRQAAALLAQRKDPQTLAYTLPLLHEADDEGRRSVIAILQAVGTADTMKAAVTASQTPELLHDVLGSLLTEASARVRGLALVGIAQLQEPFDVEPLCELLTDSDATVRRQTAAILAQHPDARIFPRLRPALQHESPDIQSNAVALFNLQGDVAALEALLEPFQEHDLESTTRVLNVLKQHSTAKMREAALPLTMHTNAFLRHCAIDLLQGTTDERVADFLLAALGQKTAWQRTWAAEALAALGETRAVPMLLPLLETGEEDERLVILHALTMLGDARAVPMCLTLVQQGTPTLQREAMAALATLTDAEHIETVIQIVMVVRATAREVELQNAVDKTFSALKQRFGDHLAGSPPTEEMGAEPLIAPSLLQDLAARESGGVEAGIVKMQQPVQSPSGTSSPIAVSDPMMLAPGTVLADRYRIVRHIGQGGFGTVILVEDRMVREQLILKFLHPHMASDERMIARFVHELRYARRVTHENVIRIHEFLKVENSYAISMEYFPSHSLSDELGPQVPLPIAHGLRIIWHVCRGMHAAHQVKVLHRDLKPPNILINDKRLVKIVDFGLAAVTNDAATRLTRTGALMGTPLYMAPELLQNRKLDARLDIYSLGVIMYEIFTGAPPYQGDNPMAILLQHVAGKATPPRDINPEIPPALEAVIQQAMAVDPMKRFQNMETLAKQIAPLLKQYAR